MYYIREITPEELAELFHERNEYYSNKTPMIPWRDVPPPDKERLIKIAKDILVDLRGF